MGLGMALLCVLTPSVATAQQGVPQTDGVRFGAFSIHPSMYTAVRYVDNIYFVPNDYAPQTPESVPQGKESDYILNVQPGTIIQFRVPNFRAQADYRFYNDTYLGTDDEDDLHSQLDASNHNFGGAMEYQAPIGVFANVRDQYTVQETFEDSDQFIDQIRGDQERNEGSATLGYRYGPEDNLYIAGRYTNVLDIYENPDISDRWAWYGDGDFRLKFLPQTAILVQGGYGEVYYNKWLETDVKCANSFMTFGQAGLAGQLTNHIRVLAKAGYQANEYECGESFDGPIGQLEFAGNWQNVTRFSVGYRRQILDAATTNFFESDEVYLTAYRLWFDRLASDLFASYQFNEFSNPNDRHEDFIQVKFDLTMELIAWLYFGGGYQYDNLYFDDGDLNNTTERNTFLVKLLAQF